MKCFIFILLIGILLIVLVLFVFVKLDGKYILEFVYEVKSVVLIECDMGSIFYNKNSWECLVLVSMIKIMIMFLIMEVFDKGNIKMSDKVRMSEYVVFMGGL